MAFPHPRTTPDWSQAEVDLLLGVHARAAHNREARARRAKRLAALRRCSGQAKGYETTRREIA